MPRRPLNVLVVAHTHWDREWYHPAGRFRQRLVSLIDDLLDNDSADAAPFLLDGQTILLDDYLAVRPEREELLSGALRAGRIEAGPWYVLADLLLPGGEALVRNLFEGRRLLDRLGAAAPPVLYAPDAFGHPAMLPAIAAGFGLPLIVLWRGLGGARWPKSDVMRWRAPDGSSALVYHLPPDGYEFGASLPADDAGADARWKRIRAVLAPRARLGLALLTNGADHHARQPRLADAIAALARAARPDRVRRTSLAAAAQAIVQRAAHGRVPPIAGELRDSYGYTWTLQGTLGSRAALKRTNAHVERLLVHDAEPWAALARRAGGGDSRPLVRAAWRAQLANHPHDTLCGTVTDEVARAAAVRFDDARTQGEGIRDAAVFMLAGHDAVAAREQAARWTAHVVVRNRAARARSGVAEIDYVIEQRREPVGPGGVRLDRARPGESEHSGALGILPSDIVSSEVRFDRAESPHHYPSNSRVVALRVLTWVPAVPGYGLCALPGAVHGVVPHPVRVSRNIVDNGILRVSMTKAGAIGVRTRRTVVTTRLLAVDIASDRGDLYTPATGETRRAKFGGGTTSARGTLRGVIGTRWIVAPPPTIEWALGQSPVTVRAIVTLDADAPFVRVRATGTNVADDHRIRVVFDTGVARARVVADAAFGPVDRAPIVVPPADRARETPPRTAPLHRYVTLYGANRGVTIYSDGLAEYEALPDGRVAITLVRAIGALSYADLDERPGHAGWPVATPEAQSPGPFEANFAIFPHGGDSDATRALVDRTADDVLLPLAGATLRSAIAPIPTTLGAELMGDGLAFSALKDAEDGDWTVLRCVNVSARPVRGAWRLGFSVREVRRARLDETPGAARRVTAGNVVKFTARPREVVTLLVR